MPTVHVSSEVMKKVEAKLVELVTNHRVPVKIQAVLAAAVLKGIDNVTINDVVSEEHLAKAINVG